MTVPHSTCQRKVRRNLDVVEACGKPITHGGGHCAEHWEKRSRLMGPCWECYFYNPVGETIGQCLRRAPVADPSRARSARWPVTAPADECGDFKDIGNG